MCCAHLGQCAELPEHSLHSWSWSPIDGSNLLARPFVVLVRVCCADGVVNDGAAVVVAGVCVVFWGVVIVLL